MSRRRAAVIAVAVLGFLLISGLLARFLSVENAERDAVLGLLRDQVRGDMPAMLVRLHRCDVACQTAVRTNAAGLRGTGPVEILNQKSATAYSLTATTGRTRVAWRQGTQLPHVQCVLVRRTGNALTGVSVTLLAVSTPIARTADC